MFGEDGIELVKARGGACNVCDAFIKRLYLFGNNIYAAIQSRDAFFKSKECGPRLAVFFVQPFEAFDELFKFHGFLQQVTLVNYTAVLYWLL